MQDPVRAWVHGHTHECCDYLHGPVRVLCNPRGYATTPADAFNGTLVVTIPGSAVVRAD
jgi:hypothetical protein